MDEPMRRSDQRYRADIKKVLLDFYQPGDTMTLTRRFRESRKCQMCDNKVDINVCYVLQNNRSKREIICGKHCIVKYADVIREMGQPPIITCDKNNRAVANTVNKVRPNTVRIEPSLEENYDRERNPETDEEFGSECGCNAGTYCCPDCDNEVCSECGEGCTCDDWDRHEDVDGDWD